MAFSFAPLTRTALRCALGLSLLVAQFANAAEGRALWVLDDSTLPKPIQTLFEKYLPATDESTETESNTSGKLSLARRLRNEIPDLLRTEGYFNPKVTIDLEQDPLRLRLELGPQTTISSVNIEFTGPINDDARFASRRDSLRENWLLAVGAGFRQNDWTRAKDDLLAATSDQDFATATLKSSEAIIDPITNTAQLHISIESGPAYTLGPLKIEGLQDYTSQIITSVNPLREGETYSRARLFALQATLQSTPYFAGVNVELVTSEGPTLTPVLVRVVEAKPKRITLGAGFSSNTGARVEIAYRHNNFLGRAWQLSTGARIEERQQTAFADIDLPREEKGHRYSFGALLDNSDIEGLEIQRQQLGAIRAHTRGNIDNAIGLALQNETTTTNNNAPETTTALALNWGWTRRAVDNLLDPRKGHVLEIQIGGASQAILSDVNFLRTYGRFQLWHALSPQDVVTARVAGGYTFAKTSQGVPQDFLFRTGGSQTVRGYDYLSIGVTDGSAVVGGRYMAVSSLEYTHWLTESSFGLSTFFDAGNARDELEGFRLLYGYGIGGRWRSPAGNLALDLAYGQATRSFRPSISLAIAF